MYNPFANYGKIVKGERFVGRKKEISEVQNRVFGESYGNLAIMGLPRIGKSSLAWNAILGYKKDLESKKIIPIDINMGKFSCSDDFFYQIIEKTYKELKFEDFSHLGKIYEDFSNISRKIDRFNSIEEFFLILKENGIRIIYILDEFDAVRNYFEIADFQFLRELSNKSDTNICIVTVSRRLLKEIEPQGGTISNFYQIFTDLYLGMFNEEDLNEYWEKFFNTKIPITEEGKDKIYDFAGKHPFLLDLFNYHLLSNLEDDLIKSIEKTKKSINLTILNNYKNIFDLLEEENLSTKLLQMVVGPVYDITIFDAEKIERYGLVKSENNKYIGFSYDFDVYLYSLAKKISIWSLWTETEIKLRDSILKHLVEKYGENWEERFIKANPNKQSLIENLKRNRDKEKKSFPDTYSINLLDFTYPADLFDGFMQTDWAWFSNIFGKQLNYWKLKFDLLAKVRNPLAHNKENILRDFEKQNTIGFCGEIISKIDEWNKKKF